MRTSPGFLRSLLYCSVPTKRLLLITFTAVQGVQGLNGGIYLSDNSFFCLPLHQLAHTIGRRRNLSASARVLPALQE